MGTFIEVAIGLTLMYLVLSLICTVINELFSTVVSLRARCLASELWQILDGQKNPALAAAFYNNGIIAAASSGSTGGDKAVSAVQGKAPPVSSHPSYLDGYTFADAMTSTALGLKAAGAVAEALPSFDDVRQAIQALPNSKIKDAMLASAVAANGDMDKLRDNIGAWFDHTMDRLSGAYKRWLKVISLVVGAIVAIALNADSIGVGRVLWNDETARGQVVQVATGIVSSDLAKNDSTDCTPLPGQKDTASQTKLGGCVKSILGELNTYGDTLRPFPIGWSASNNPNDVGGWAVKLLGLVWTALALSLGAPFWFDVLSMFVQIRGAGTKPTRTEDKTRPADKKKS